MRARLVPVFLALCVSVGACSDGGEEPDAAPTLPAITESPSPSPEPDAVPPQATEATPEGAAEFVRYWFDSLNQAAQDGDTETLKAVSDPACETCSRFISSIENLYGPGGRIEGGQFNVTAVEAQSVPAEAREAKALVVYDVTPTRQVGPQGETILQVEALSNETGDLVLARTPAGWTLKEFS
jgi:hypothetical protein